MVKMKLEKKLQDHRLQVQDQRDPVFTPKKTYDTVTPPRHLQHHLDPGIMLKTPVTYVKGTGPERPGRSKTGGGKKSAPQPGPMQKATSQVS